MPNLKRSQRVAGGLIKRWGKQGFLIRDQGTADEQRRRVNIARGDYSPRDRATLALEGVERLYVSAAGLNAPIDYEKEIIEFDAKFYRINTEPRGHRPNGIVIYYDCQCIYVGLAA